MLLDRVVKGLQLKPETLDYMGVYNITNISEYCYAYPDVSFLDENTVIYFPHELMWLEWKVVNDEPPFNAVESGLLIVCPKISYMGRRVASLSFFCAPAGGRAVCIAEGAIEVNPKTSTVNTTKNGIPYTPSPMKVLGAQDGPFGYYSNGRTLKEEDKSLYIQEAFHRLHMMCQFLNCGNVIKREHVVPEKLMKKYQKHGSQRYVMKHYTLEINGNTNKSNSDGTGGGGLKAWHICRGHFKTYTADNPLFGKITGTFFWGATVKGSKKVGKITKDYEVKI